jgi:hypothetical protein
MYKELMTLCAVVEYNKVAFTYIYMFTVFTQQLYQDLLEAGPMLEAQAGSLAKV